MPDINLFVKSLAHEIECNQSKRFKFQTILQRFGYESCNSEFLSKLDQILDLL